ncbi:MAG: ABC transporter permease subunit [Bifidobacterium pseudocatenulatum]
MAIMISGGQSGLWSGILASGISITGLYSAVFRTIRSEVIRIKESAYVDSARVVGASTWRIMTKHLLKNSTQNVTGYFDVELVRSDFDSCGIGLPWIRHRTYCSC